MEIENKIDTSSVTHGPQEIARAGTSLSIGLKLSICVIDKAILSYTAPLKDLLDHI